MEQNQVNQNTGSKIISKQPLTAEEFSDFQITLVMDKSNESTTFTSIMKLGDKMFSEMKSGNLTYKHEKYPCIACQMHKVKQILLEAKSLHDTTGDDYGELLSNFSEELKGGYLDFTTKFTRR